MQHHTVVEPDEVTDAECVVDDPFLFQECVEAASIVSMTQCCSVDVEGDRRAYRVRLTARGRKQFHEMARQHEEWIVEAFSGLTDREIATLHKLLGKVKDHATTQQETAA